MPQKKNPDILELIRATVGKVLGDLSSVLIMMKGLPLSYNRDMQLDKPPLFSSVDSVKEILEIFAELFKGVRVKKVSLEKKIEDESLFAVDVMEYLIKKGIPYRIAHDTVGNMVRKCLDRGKKFSDLSLGELKKYSNAFEADVKKLLNAKASVKLKKSYGGTSPVLVQKQIKSWKGRLNARV